MGEVTEKIGRVAPKRCLPQAVHIETAFSSVMVSLIPDIEEKLNHGLSWLPQEIKKENSVAQ